jgi:uracil-DNA glycosylase
MTEKKILMQKLFRLVRLASDYVDTGIRKEYESEPTFESSGTIVAEKNANLSATPDQLIEKLDETVRACTKCRLHMARKKAVPGEGVIRPRVMIVGEAPGEDEDLSGRPFLGPAGQYLSKWIEAIGLDRFAQTYVTNVVKCHPPQNRQPSDDECGACFPYLVEQIETLAPVTILSVGLVSSKLLTRRANANMTTLRERVYEYAGTPLVVTYHPNSVLRDQSLRKPVWDDLKKLQSILEQFP